MASNDDIVIIGAGVVGLDVALVLAQQGLGRHVTVIGEYLPGDTSATYTSPWAGCNFSAISGSDANALKWDRLGYAHLTKLASESPKEAFVEWASSTEYWEETVPRDKIKHLAGYLKDYESIPEKDLLKGMKFGIKCKTFVINAPKHIEYLHGHLRDHYGVRFIRKKLSHVNNGYLSPSTKIVFNCTGIAAKTLPGVEDAKVYPTRGQVVLVKAPRVKEIAMIHGNGYETYIIPRPGSKGNVILGGYMQKGVGDPSTFNDETADILARTKKLDTRLASSDTEVLASFAGLRPSREGGNRIERTEVSINGSKKILVHNYGAGGTGFQAGYGMALDAVKTVEEELREIRQASSKARL